MSYLNINTYKGDGFEKVCDVNVEWDESWYYTNINRKLMFSTHKSWIYFIVLDDQIFKIGETGNPLGLEMSLIDNYPEKQPKTGTKSRLGRYRKGDGTDKALRDLLEYEVRHNRVSIWAKYCDLIEVEVSIGGIKSKTYTSFNKDIELRYLDHIVKHTGKLPLGNKCRK